LLSDESLFWYLASGIPSFGILSNNPLEASLDLAQETAVRPIERARSLAQIAVSRLREAIVNGDLPLGASLSERTLAERLAISKTPVREALAQLRLEGLIRISPQRGAFVFTLSAQEVVEICEVRQSLEASAMRYALERHPDRLVCDLSRVVEAMTAARARGDVRAYLAADTDYHQCFFRHCGNGYMADAYGMFVGKIAALRTHLAGKPQHTEKSFAEHKRMLALLQEGKLAEALATLDTHIGRTKTTYAAEIEDIAAADRAGGVL
jgi:DNA-binding GntR family transcriptional regulator